MQASLRTLSVQARLGRWPAVSLNSVLHRRLPNAFVIWRQSTFLTCEWCGFDSNGDILYVKFYFQIN